MDNKEILNEVARFARGVNNLYIEMIDKINHPEPVEDKAESGEPPIPLGFISLEQREALENAAYNKLRAEQIQAAHYKMLMGTARRVAGIDSDKPDQKD